MKTVFAVAFWSFVFSIITLGIAISGSFLLSSNFIHDGANTSIGRILEASWIWPMYIVKKLNMAGPSAFAFLILLALAGYFSVFALGIGLIRSYRYLKSRQGRISAQGT